MSPLSMSCIVFACVFAGSLLGLVLGKVLPAHHLSGESKDVVKLGMGLVGTMAALVLGLLVASAKGSYDTQSSELTQMSANLIMLDRTLAHYGPETKEARDILRAAANRVLTQMWPGSAPEVRQPVPTAAGGEVLYDRIQQLSPTTDAQRTMQGQALSIAIGIGQMRWLLFEQ